MSTPKPFSARLWRSFPYDAELHAVHDQDGAVLRFPMPLPSGALGVSAGSLSELQSNPNHAAAQWASARLIDQVIAALPQDGPVAEKTLDGHQRIRRVAEFRQVLASVGTIPAKHALDSLDVRSRVIRHLLDIGARGYALHEADLIDVFRSTIGIEVNEEDVAASRAGGFYTCDEFGEPLDVAHEEARRKEREERENLRVAAVRAATVTERSSADFDDAIFIIKTEGLDPKPTEDSEPFPTCVLVKKVSSIRTLYAARTLNLEFPAHDLHVGLRVCKSDEAFPLTEAEADRVRNAPVLAGIIRSFTLARGVDHQRMVEEDFVKPGTARFSHALKLGQKYIDALALGHQPGAQAPLPLAEILVRGCRLPVDAAARLMQRGIAARVRDSRWDAEICGIVMMKAVDGGTIKIGECFTEPTIGETIGNTFESALDSLKSRVAGRDQVSRADLLDALPGGNGPEKQTLLSSLMQRLGFESKQVGPAEQRVRVFARTEPTPTTSTSTATPPVPRPFDPETRESIEADTRKGARTYQEMASAALAESARVSAEVTAMLAGKKP